jgi:hypothetical protein
MTSSHAPSTSSNPDGRVPPRPPSRYRIKQLGGMVPALAMSFVMRDVKLALPWPILSPFCTLGFRFRDLLDLVSAHEAVGARRVAQTEVFLWLPVPTRWARPLTTCFPVDRTGKPLPVVDVSCCKLFAVTLSCTWHAIAQIITLNVFVITGFHHKYTFATIEQSPPSPFQHPPPLSLSLSLSPPPFPHTDTHTVQVRWPRCTHTCSVPHSAKKS